MRTILLSTDNTTPKLSNSGILWWTAIPNNPLSKSWSTRRAKEARATAKKKARNPTKGKWWEKTARNMSKAIYRTTLSLLPTRTTERSTKATNKQPPQEKKNNGQALIVLLKIFQISAGRGLTTNFHINPQRYASSTSSWSNTAAWNSSSDRRTYKNCSWLVRAVLVRSTKENTLASWLP